MAKQTEVLKTTELLGQQFTVYGSIQEPLFVASDVATMINHPNTSELVKLVDDDEKLTSTILRAGQKRDVWMLTENGLYEVLMQSRKPIAKQFKKGVKVILKEIRTTGGYIATTDTDTPELIMARALQVAQQAIERNQMLLEAAQQTIKNQDEELKAVAPKVEYFDNTLQSVNTYTSTQMAKELRMREAKQLHRILHERGVMFKQSGQWLLTADYSERGYTKTKTHYYTRNDGTTGTNTVTVWTERGRHFLHEFFNNFGQTLFKR